jgi:hypothetical protein
MRPRRNRRSSRTKWRVSATANMVTMTLLQGVIKAFVMFFARLVAFTLRPPLETRFAALSTGR